MPIIPVFMAVLFLAVIILGLIIPSWIIVTDGIIGFLYPFFWVWKTANKK